MNCFKGCSEQAVYDSFKGCSEQAVVQQLSCTQIVSKVAANKLYMIVFKGDSCARLVKGCSEQAVYK